MRYTADRRPETPADYPHQAPDPTWAGKQRRPQQCWELYPLRYQKAARKTSNKMPKTPMGPWCGHKADCPPSSKSRTAGKEVLKV